MFIKRLRIESKSRIIRDLCFSKGINLIVDDTPSLQKSDSSDIPTGNSVGKTTVLKLIDFCLGAPSSIIYSEHGVNQSYDLVKDFLVDNEVLITLFLTESFDDPKAKEICIERNFLSRKQGVRTINGVPYTKDRDFDDEIKKLSFPQFNADKPTFRQIVSHNIRYSDESISHTLKTLNKYTTDIEYETLYLFLFGLSFDDGAKRQSLMAKLNQEIAFKSRLEKRQTKSTYEAALALVDSEIVALDRKKKNLHINNNFEQDLSELNQARYQINSLASSISNLSIRKDLIDETQSELNSEKSNIDLQQLRIIYLQAKQNLSSLQKSFEELVEFHNQMIEEKIRFVTKELPTLEIKIEQERKKLNMLLAKEERLSQIISKSDSFEALEQIISDTNEAYRKKGEYENIITQISEVDESISKCNRQLNDLNEDIFTEEFESELKLKINKFNEFFSSVSQALYGEKYLLKHDVGTVKKTGQKVYKFSAFNANLSSGKKQGEILCFDVAYVLFADSNQIPCLHFLLNDKKELMHGNQLSMFKDYISDKNIQFVASILKDKLPADLNEEEFFIVELSQTSKLFDIE